MQRLHPLPDPREGSFERARPQLRPASGRSQQGLAAIEYALIASLIAMAIVVGASELRNATGGIFQTVATSVGNATGGSGSGSGASGSGATPAVSGASGAGSGSAPGSPGNSGSAGGGAGNPGKGIGGGGGVGGGGGTGGGKPAR